MKKIISLLLTIVMLFSVSTAVLAADVPQQDYPQRFWDVPKDYWAYEYIERLAFQGIINGYDDGTYLPEKQVTRAEWATMLSNTVVKNNSPNDVTLADDLDEEAWWTPYLRNVYSYFPPKKEILNGVEILLYRPDEFATREDVTASVIRVLEYNLDNADLPLLYSFSDYDAIDQNNRAYIALAIEKGIINGFEDKTFRGKEPLTRSQAATILTKAITLYSEEHYIGEKANGVPHGQGRCNYIGGDKYEGEWQNGERHGYGTYYWFNGDKYEGEWQNSKLNGIGTFFWSNGSRYEGEWQNSERNGYGTCYWSNGDKYEGEWQNDERNGYGTCYWSNGDKYEGEWQNDERNGYGTYYWSNGNKYEGEWQNGERNGYGTYYFADGKYLAGNWVNNEFIG